MKERQKVEEEWGEMGEINNSQKVDQTDPLAALGSEMKAKSHNISRERANQSWKMKYRECEKRNPQRRNAKQIWGFGKKIETGSIAKQGTFFRIPFLKSQKGKC